MKKAIIDLSLFFPYQLSQLQATVSNCIAQVYGGKYQLSRQEWRVLATLNNQEALNASQIGEQCDLDKMPTSRAIKSLVERGLILRREDTQDKRASLLSLSDTGQNLMQDIAPLVLAQEQEILSALSPKEQATMVKLLEKLQAHANSLNH
ncbi:MarR family winged helix-turn-helix transcriptional regulator [Thalassotalea marina]|uniref:Transcriptional regulator n=1 Tax=Thalassotalea marina TaxID=1673741 RepID=A0A919EHK4_9GAMM|nr:MarR family transcriptional regulator [Thalassotalea marina]GHF79182.1 transcriptional regulator [Thalassotalea marina]